MKTIYLDLNYMCHLNNNDGWLEIQTDIFDNMPNTAIPYYRYIPENHTWIDEQNRVFHGIFIQATNSEAINQAIQAAYISDMQNALNLLGVTE